MSLIKVNEDKLKEIKLQEVEYNRKSAYLAESDPLFFKSQRGEISIEEWKSKIQEIKDRYPKP